MIFQVFRLFLLKNFTKYSRGKRAAPGKLRLRFRLRTRLRQDKCAGRRAWYRYTRCGIEESRVRGGRRRARRPHASKLLRESAKAEATKVARTSGGRAISRERRGKSAGGGRPTSAGAITKGN